MDLSTILLMAIGLAMDTLAVSIASGAILKHPKMKHAAHIALFFGGFQLLMAVLGWLAGFALASLISQFTPWLAFGLLSLIGVRMISEALKSCPAEKRFDPLNIYVLLVLSVATSIDSLMVGFSLAFLGFEVLVPAVTIGAVTFAISFAGVFVGKKFGHICGNKAELIGGIILLSIGLRILLESVL
ncbi:MAG: manganese efflux pump [Candidatus Altiarchaeota archaeon]|nr:manganese efflux pump [Candidatus Altiarchaeota archaeon]